MTFISQLLSAQPEPVKWFYTSQKTAENEYNLLITANIDKNWNIYSQYLESEDGPIATSFKFDTSSSIEYIGKTKEEGEKKSGFDAMFQMNVTKYAHKVVFIQKIKVKPGTTAVKGVLTFMCCDDEMCLPPKDVNFEIGLKN